MAAPRRFASKMKKMFSRGFTVLPRHATLAIRWVKRLVVLVLLLLLIGTIFLWAFSCWVCNDVQHTRTYNTSTHTYHITERFFSNQGRLNYLRQSWTLPHDVAHFGSAGSTWTHATHPADQYHAPGSTFANWLGFGWRTTPFTRGGAVPVVNYRVWFPHWSIALLTAVAPAAWLIAYPRRRRRHLAGHCRNCGYDLRATPDRCPECGTTPAGAVA
jgi:hypothetical protein